MNAKFYKWKKKDLILQIILQPRTKNDEFVGIFNQRLKIKIQVPPVENRGNKRLIKFLAKQFGVPISDVAITNRHHSKQKTVTIKSPKIINPDLEIN